MRTPDTPAVKRVRYIARILAAAWLCFLVYWTITSVTQTLMAHQGGLGMAYAALYVVFWVLCLGACVCALIPNLQRLGGVLLAVFGVLFFLLNLYEIFRVYTAEANLSRPEMQYLAQIEAVEALPKLLLVALPPLVAGLLFVTSFRLRRTLEEQMLKNDSAMILMPETTPPIEWQHIIASCLSVPWLVFGLLLIVGGITGVTAGAAARPSLTLTLVVAVFGVFCLGSFICAFQKKTQGLGGLLLMLCGLIVLIATIVRIWMTPLQEPLPPTVYGTIGIFSLPPIIAGFLLYRSRKPVSEPPANEPE